MVPGRQSKARANKAWQDWGSDDSEANVSGGSDEREPDERARLAVRRVYEAGCHAGNEEGWNHTAGGWRRQGVHGGHTEQEKHARLAARRMQGYVSRGREANGFHECRV